VKTIKWDVTPGVTWTAVRRHMLQNSLWTAWRYDVVCQVMRTGFCSSLPSWFFCVVDVVCMNPWCILECILMWLDNCK